jgi:hypothetical protein
MGWWCVHWVCTVWWPVFAFVVVISVVVVVVVVLLVLLLYHWPGNLAEPVMLPSLTKDLPCCSLCTQTSFPNWCFCGFPQTLLANALIISEIRPRPLPSTVLPIKCHWTHHHIRVHCQHDVAHISIMDRWQSAGVKCKYECCNNAIVDRRKSWPPEHKTLILWNVTKGLGYGCFLYHNKVDPPLPIAEVKKEWSYTSTPAIHLYVVWRQNFTLIK